MAKRTATRDINHENWDQEDEPEEAGTFQRASEEQLKSRVIKTAKRRNFSSQGSDGEKTGAFSAFSGFGKPQTPTTSAFSFLSNLTSTNNTSKTNGVPATTATHSISPMFKTTESKIENTTEKNSNLDEYYSKLKGLNESVAKFIKTHVEANPFINLQPVFKDYDNYINDLDKLRDSLLAENKESASESEKSAFTSFVFKPTARNSIESVKTPVSENDKIEPAKTTPQFSFGFSSSNSIFSGAKPVTTGFTFGAATDSTKQSTAGFSFNTTSSIAPSFSFSNSAATTQNEENKEEEEDSEPPKPDFTPVVEEGHIYTTRCKVFVKKNGSFADKGVGNLFLKPIPSSEKVQLIVRADTNLGNLLCNFILSESIPIKRLGKKDVMLVCIPTPDTKPPPVPILLRVKSPEEADRLLENLEKHKK